MRLICDLCGGNLTATDNQHAKCENCGIEYGPERLQEMRGAKPAPVPKSEPNPEPVFVFEPMSTSEPKPEPEKKNSGCGIWFLLIMAVADLVVGTHGIVAVFCLLIMWIIYRCSKKK